MNRPSPIVIRCTWFDCVHTTSLLDPDDGWVRDAAGDWCPDHTPDPLFHLDHTED